MNQIQMEVNLRRNLRTLLAANQITAIKLADNIGVSPQMVNHWCTGYAKPGISDLGKVSQFFGVTVDAILTKQITIKLAVK